jgi:hypothetical protein
MMKCGIVMSSALSEHNRWDAGFHLLNEQYKSKAAALAKALSAEEAVAILTDESVFPTRLLQALGPLCRGNGHSSRGWRAPLIKAIKEYPHLALAIVSESAEAQIQEQQADLANRAAALQRVSARLQAVEKLVADTANSGALAAASLAPASEAVPQAHLTTEKLDGVDMCILARDTDVVDEPQGLLPIPEELRALLATHRFVAGVVYRDGDDLVIPVHTSETHWLSDCWVIDLAEWVGPQMLDDLVAEGNVPIPRRYQDLGTPIGFLELPGHEQNYGMGWRG